MAHLALVGESKLLIVRNWGKTPVLHQFYLFLEQLVASANPEALKKVIVAKLIKKQVETPLSHEWVSYNIVVTSSSVENLLCKQSQNKIHFDFCRDCRETCQKLTDWILTSDAEYLR